MLTAAVVDAQGREVPVADNELEFKVSGSGKLLGLGNGDPSSHELDIASSRRVFNGLCMAVVQASKETGEIHVEASSPGLEPGSVSVTAVSAPLRPAVP
jgi:beta-galactosidase